MYDVYISIIIPIYNSKLYLNKCLDSIIGQNLYKIEIICIDDGSTDSSFEILKKYQKKDNRFIIIRQKNRGASYARNIGIKIAKGKYIAFIDSDDWYPNDSILSLLYYKSEKNDAKICGGSFSYYKKGKIIRKFDGSFKLYKFNKEGFIEYKNYQYDYGFHRFLYRRSFLLENKLFFPNYSYYEDPPFLVLSMVVAKKFYAIPNISYVYRIKNNKKLKLMNAYHILKGVKKNMELAKKYNLLELYKISFDRINIDFYRDIIYYSNKYNTIKSLLIDINLLLDKKIIKNKILLDIKNKYFMLIYLKYKNLKRNFRYDPYYFFKLFKKLFDLLYPFRG